jgi:hypothetical protein
MVRRGQSGIEFLAVTGIGLVLLLGVSFFLLSDSKASKDQAQLRQIQQIGAEVIAKARVVQAQGRNSWVTVDAQVPDSVSAIYTVENNTLVFDVNTQNGVISQPIFSEVAIAGLRDVPPKRFLDTGTFHAGVVRFTVYSNASVVLLSVQ